MNPLKAIAVPLLCCLSLLAAAPLAHSQKGDPASEASRAFRNYLSHQRASIDAKFSPDERTREAGAARAKHLAPSIKDFDLEATAKTLKASPRYYQNLGIYLRKRSTSADSEFLRAQANLKTLEQLRQDPNTEEKDKPTAEQLDDAKKTVAWSRARVSYLDKATTALRGELTPQQRALKNYLAVLQLEETRATATNREPGKKKKIAEAERDLLDQQLSGQTLEAARAGLADRQVSNAANEVSTRLKPIPQRRTALSGRYPEEENVLRSLQTLYEQELKALRELQRAARARLPGD